MKQDSGSAVTKAPTQHRANHGLFVHDKCKFIDKILSLYTAGFNHAAWPLASMAVNCVDNVVACWDTWVIV
jgi:hypothetical protein